jgi:hypothetical protein
MKFSDEEIENGAYIEISGGSQIAQVYRRERKYRQDGYVAMPLNCGSGDPYGVYTTWIPESLAHRADMTRWLKSEDGSKWVKQYGKGGPCKS